MSFHTAAYAASIANCGNVDTAALNDFVLAITNGHFQPQKDYDLIWAFAGSATITRARLVSPSNRQVTLPFIRPVNLGVTPTSDIFCADYRANPFRIRQLEELAVEISQGGAGAENAFALLGLQTNFQPVPRGDIFTIRGTGTTTLVANQWTQATITWADALPAGAFAVVGLNAFSATAKAARLGFEGQYERPGCVGSILETNRPHTMFEKGGLGVWGTFRSTRMPVVEYLANAADTAETVYMDIIRIAG